MMTASKSLPFLISLLFVAGIAFAQPIPSIEDFQAPTLAIPIIVGLALLDSINPCVIGVLILLLTILLKTGNKRAILINGSAYTAGVYLTYIIGGLTLLGIFNTIREIVFVSQMLYFFVGSVLIFVAFLEIKDFFWYGRWYSLGIPARFVNFVERKASGTSASMWAAFSFGVIITLIELPCTGAPYLALLTLMSQSGFGYITALPLLLLYNLVFVVPLLVIIYLAYSGLGMKRIEKWRIKHRGQMRLYIGLALLAIGIWIITAVAGFLLVPLVSASLAIIALMGVVKYVFKK